MTDAPATLAASLADRYRIERALGAGGMATVYEAEDLRHHRQVALKVLRPELAATIGTTRFEREIEIAAHLQHPHILALLDSGEAGGFLYYVMPYVEGESLRRRLEREGALPISDAVRILRDVVDALTEAHAHGVVHRDLKPENVMLRGRHALVTDFGVAKAVSEATGRQALTTAGLALGTPEYMAPEQASADPHVDHRVDIYAVGALAYELLTGRPVFMRVTPREVLAAHLTELPVPISKRRETVPPALEAVVMRCLEKKPADRWQSADELLPQLEALVTPSGGITPTRSQPRPWRPGRRWARASVGVTALLLVAAAVALALRGARRSGGGGPGAVTDRSVAVLAFRPLSGDTADTFLTTGLAEDIATTLGQVRLVAVKSPAAVARAQAATAGDVAALGRVLRVRYVVDGSLRRMGDSVRVSARLVEPTTETQVWAVTYDRLSRELVRVPVDIARDLAVWLAGMLPPAEQAALERRPTQNPEAYEAYLQGNAKFFLRQLDANVSGIADYRRALALDPRFEAARARIAMMLAQQHDYGWYPAGTDSAALLREALARADSTVERDPALAEGWTARCYVLYQLARLGDALDACDRALALNPRDLEGHNRRGWVLLDLGRDSAAAAEAARCLEIDAGWHLPHLLLGRVATESGSLAEALARYDDLLRLAPGYMPGHYHRGRVRLLLGDERGAREDLEALRDPVGALTLGALLQARTGHPEAARAAAERLSPWPTYAAMVYASLQDSQRALEMLESTTPLWIDLRAREFDPLRSDPRFERVVAAAALARDRR